MDDFKSMDKLKIAWREVLEQWSMLIANRGDFHSYVDALKRFNELRRGVSGCLHGSRFLFGSLKTDAS